MARVYHLLTVFALAARAVPSSSEVSRIGTGFTSRLTGRFEMSGTLGY